MESNTMFHQDNEILLTAESSESTSVSVIKPTGITSTSIFLQGLFVKNLHKGVSTVVSLQPSLLMSLQDHILCHLYKGNSMVVPLLSSLLASLRNKFLRSSLNASLRSEFLRSSLLASLWNIFLRRLYGDISMVKSIPSKPKILLQRISKFMILSIQAKPETSTFWLLLHESIQSSVTHFYKYIGYYVINRTTNNDTWDIQKQTIGYILFLKRKQSGKMKAKRCAKEHHHRKYNYKVESSSHIIPSYALVGSSLTNTMDYNLYYKLMSVIGREHDFTANKWKCFDIQVRATLLWTWMISRALVDYTDMGRIVSGILDNVQAPYVSMKTVSDPQFHISVHQWWYTQGPMIIYEYII